MEPGAPTKQVRNTAKPPAAGKGRPKGAPNKVTGQVKEMILAALDKAGGVDYLAEQADKTPAAFLSLVGKVLPLTIAGDAANPIKHVIEASDELLAAIATGQVKP